MVNYRFFEMCLISPNLPTIQEIYSVSVASNMCCSCVQCYGECLNTIEYHISFLNEMLRGLNCCTRFTNLPHVHMFFRDATCFLQKALRKLQKEPILWTAREEVGPKNKLSHREEQKIHRKSVKPTKIQKMCPISPE